MKQVDQAPHNKLVIGTSNKITVCRPAVVGEPKSLGWMYEEYSNIFYRGWLVRGQLLSSSFLDF